MKTTLLSLLAAASVLGVMTPASAQSLPPLPPNVNAQPYPGERRIMSYLTNGTPVYAVYQIVGYDAMGYPIYQWVTQSQGYVRPYYYGHGRSYGYGYHSYGYRGYGYNYHPTYVRPIYVRPMSVSPFRVHPHPVGRMGFVGHFSHGGGHVSHGGGHMSHGGGHGGGHHH